VEDEVTTIQTTLNVKTNQVSLRSSDNCPLLISSTSWSSDEDFQLLLDALIGLDALLAQEIENLRLAVVVTGKGPLKLEFENKVDALNLKRVGIKTVWLEPEDYPLIMACSDLGVCLHTSTSGLDLPMKVLDMFGCGVPVVAVSFATLPELVRHGENGLIFSSSIELQNQISSLLFPHLTATASPAENWETTSASLCDLKAGAMAFESWDEHWKANMKPFVSSLLANQNSVQSRKRRKFLFLSGLCLCLFLSSMYMLWNKLQKR
jgi:beta-1,4-mannosyltransferase